MKSFREQLERHFDWHDQARGRQYFKNGVVGHIHIVGSKFSANIRGSYLYESWIDTAMLGRGRGVGLFCSCPRFADKFSCKHLWALALAIEHLEGTGLSAHAKPEQSAPAALKGTKSWREIFPEAKLKRKIPHGSLCKVVTALTLEIADHDPNTLRFRFYTIDLDSNARPISQPKFVTPSIHGPPPFKAGPGLQAYKLLSAIAMSERDPYGYRYGLNPYQDSHVLKVSIEAARSALPSLFDSMPVYLTAKDFFDSLNESSDRRLKYAKLAGFTADVLDEGEDYLLRGKFSLPEPIALSRLKELSAAGIYQFEHTFASLELTDDEAKWFEMLRHGDVKIPAVDRDAFLETALNQPFSLTLPESLQWCQTNEAPKAFVRLDAEKRDDGRTQKYNFDLQFTYGQRSVSDGSSLQKLVCGEELLIHRRNSDEETRLWALLPTSYLSCRTVDGVDQFAVSAKDLLPFVNASLEAGIPIELNKQRVQVASDFEIGVSSGVDWFDVEAKADFSGLWVRLPQLLAAVRRGESFVPLENGTTGLMDAALQKRLCKLADFADESTDGLRFQKAQGFLLHALLEDELKVDVDKKFAQIRARVRNFSGLTPSAAGSKFKGKLRRYQKEGLGWLEFLESFGLGGILADDMGLGKTIQCLAFLDKRRQTAKRKRAPSLLLAPKSVLENWRSEAEKFTPELKVLVLSGPERESSARTFKKYDLIVTSYQTMLRDFAHMKDVAWDCVVIDEAQVIKNALGLTAKSVKNLRADFRLAMTGTPIENSIQDLFSISDFVNPGFLRGRRTLHSTDISEDSKRALARAFKPVILRRTKETVLKDLPPKTEQVITVELEPKQLKKYDELKRFYRSQLSREIDEKGLKNSQIQILAALTRLRQAALHPGLIDPSLLNTKSAKLEVMLEMLEEILSENHRVLIFSQFTSLLAIVKTELRKRQIDFAYLDGKTLDRKKVVDDFKAEAKSVFLISLKAGGVGLNLVEADYVFLLDPWWNPAVEAQAIDRVHRIGQTRPVNAYRFIAKGTVEEKILDLQKAKKNIASSILDQGGSLMRNLTAQDIESLLD